MKNCSVDQHKAEETEEEKAAPEVAGSAADPGQ